MERLPIPIAYADPAFWRGVEGAIGVPELIEQFDRVYGCKLSRIGKDSVIERMTDEATRSRDEQLRRFAEFVHYSVY
jgi:hypothetical protein